MTSFWDFVSGKQNTQHNLQEGLFQIVSQTCGILVQVNNTNNINIGRDITNINVNNLSASDLSADEPHSVLISPSGKSHHDDPSTSSASGSCRRQSTRGESAKRLLSNYKQRLVTILETKPSSGDDDDSDLWDNHHMLRSDFQNDSWNNGKWCFKPSCIPITIILILIVLVVLLPLWEHSNEALHAKPNDTKFICNDKCRIQLVESIPEGLNFSQNSPKFLSTFDAWSILLNLANESLDIGSLYWTLRGADVFNHTSAWQGEKIFQQILFNGMQQKYRIRIAQSSPTQNQPNLDTELLAKRKAAEVRSVNFPRLIGGGVLHTKLWIVDGQHFYLGSANMDWRSLTQVKELGVLITNCNCLAKDVSKIFEAYWFLGLNNSHIPSKWPEEYSTNYNINTPIEVKYNDNDDLFKTFFSNSPPPLNSIGRTNDLDAIINVILHAERFVHIAVMDYFPLLIYTPKIKYWPYIDDAIRTAAVENKVSVKLLISWWVHSRPAEDYFLQSLTSLSSSFQGVDIEIRRFIVPADENQAKIPFGRVNHNKYMVTDNTAYIGTSNWSGDYFTDTAGIGLIIRDSDYDRANNETTFVTELASVFERDWNSPYAVQLIKP